MLPLFKFIDEEHYDDYNEYGCNKECDDILLKSE